MNLFTKQKQTQRLRKQTYGYQRRNVGGVDKLGVWDWHIHTMIYKIDNHKDLLPSTGSCTQWSENNYMGKKYLEKNRYMYMYN